MKESPSLDLDAAHLAIVQGVLRRHVPGRRVWAFGSRVCGRAGKYSDLDLAIIGDDPLPLPVLAGMKEDFAESDLPCKVDVVDWATAGEAFRRIIGNDHLTVQEG